MEYNKLKNEYPDLFNKQIERESEDLNRIVKRMMDKVEEAERFNVGSSTDYAVSIKGQIAANTIEYLNQQVKNALNPELNGNTELVFTKDAEALRAIRKCLGIDLVNKKRRTKKEQKETEYVRQYFELKKAVCIAVHLAIDAALSPQEKTTHIGLGGDEKTSHSRPTHTQLAKHIGFSVMRQVCLTIMSRNDSQWFKEVNSKAKRRSKEVLPSSSFYYNYYIQDHASQRCADLSLKGKLRPELTDVYRFSIWTSEEIKQVGKWMLKGIEESCPDIFRRVKTQPKSNIQFLAFTEQAEEQRMKFYADMQDIIHSQSPMICPPIDNSKKRLYGWISPASHYKPNSHKGKFLPSDQHLRVINALQDVPYQINPFIYQVMKYCRDHNRPLGSFNYYEYEEPDSVANRIGLNHLPYEDQSAEIHSLKQSEEGKAIVKKAQAKRGWEKATRKAQFIWNTPSRLIWESIQQCVGHERIWCPASYGPRGRLYFRTGYLNPQGQDHAKAILRYANPTKLDSRSQYWMEIELANAAGQDKKTYEKRQEWVQEHLHYIKLVALMFSENGDAPSALAFLDTIPDCWTFAAAAEEYYHCFIKRDRHHSQIRCGIDATAQAGQIISGWRRSLAGAKKTNCIINPEPSDAYLELWKAIKDLCAHSTEGNLRVQLMRDWDEYGFGRKAAKAVMMVAQYGAGKSCMARDLAKKVYSFAKQYQPTSDELRLMNSVLERAVDRVASVSKMVDWCKSVAYAAYQTPLDVIETVDDKGNTVTECRSRTVLKLPCMPETAGAEPSVVLMKYGLPKTHLVNTFSAGSMKLDAARFTHIIYHPDEPDLDRWLKAITANWVHSADQTILCRALDGWTANFTTIHDMFQSAPGMLMDALYIKLRQGYHDVITWNPWQAIADLNDLKIDDGTLTDEERQDCNVIPAPPIVGDLDPDLCLKANYMFC